MQKNNFFLKFFSYHVLIGIFLLISFLWIYTPKYRKPRGGQKSYVNFTFLDSPYWWSYIGLSLHMFVIHCFLSFFCFVICLIGCLYLLLYFCSGNINEIKKYEKKYKNSPCLKFKKNHVKHLLHYQFTTINSCIHICFVLSCRKVVLA